MTQPAADDSLTVLEIIRRTTEYFREKEIDSPRLTVELLLCAALGCDRVKLYLHYDKPLREKELMKLREMVKRRARREPLQYIIGSTEFYGLPIIVSPATLIPRPETELLVESVKKYIENRGNSAANILDVGTGSGCIAVALGKTFPSATITATDISEAALETARSNARHNRVENITFIRDDVLGGAELSGCYDVIVSNPPYISRSDMNGLQPEVGQFEPHSALTDNADGLTFYRKFAEVFPKHLAAGGKFFVEIGFGQEAAVSLLFSSAGFAVEVQNDFAGIPRIVSGSL